jgi:hypothetical protein
MSSIFFELIDLIKKISLGELEHARTVAEIVTRMSCYGMENVLINFREILLVHYVNYEQF